MSSVSPHGTITNLKQVNNTLMIPETAPRVITCSPVAGGPSIVRGFPNEALANQWITANAFLINDVSSSRQF